MQIMFRASIIPYMISSGRVFFGLGLDSRYLEITDFGGRTDFYDMNHKSTAIREYQEETSAPGIFDGESVEIESGNHHIFICKVPNYIMHNWIQHISNLEIKKGFILSHEDLDNIINGGEHKGYRLWDSLKDVLRENNHIIRSISEQSLVDRVEKDDIST